MKKSTFVVILCIGIFLLMIVASVLFGCKALQDSGMMKDLAPSLSMGMHLGLGEAAFERGVFNLAESEFKAATVLAEGSTNDEDLGECYTRLGQTYKRLGKKDEALKMLAKADKQYEKANEGFLLSIEKRVWKQGLMEYSELLKAAGNVDESKVIAEKANKLREKLGPMESVREKLSQF